MKENYEVPKKLVPLLKEDYVNEIGPRIDSLKTDGVDGLKNLPVLRTLNERYETFKESAYPKVATIDEFFKQVVPPEYHELFFQQREQLDALVKEFNSELKKENPDPTVIKKIINEMWFMCKNEKVF